MTPNLFVATQTLFSPHKWFKSSSRKGQRPTRKSEHWDSPVPGIYEYIPGRGWYLVATDKIVPGEDSINLSEPGTPTSPDIFSEKQAPRVVARETIKMTPPIQVKYSKVLKRYLLSPDYEMRKRHGKIQSTKLPRSNTSLSTRSTATHHTEEAGFFQLDDGIAWVQCWDSHGEFIPGPYKLWCIDSQTGDFRHMLKGDDPEYVTSRTNSFEPENFPSPTSPTTSTAANAPGRRSQDSRSTTFNRNSPAGPGSFRDGPSVASTRANSIRNFAPGAATPGQRSRAGSQVPSRRTSPKRATNEHLPLEEAKAKLRIMAEEQKRLDAEKEKVRSRANSEERGPAPGAAESRGRK